MDETAEILILTPFAGVLAGMLWVLIDHYFGWKGTLCHKVACHRWGQSNFTCCQCSKRAIYFCYPCAREIMEMLREYGSVAVTCTYCAKKQTEAA